MIDHIVGILIGLVLLIFMLIANGCELVNSTNRVIYEDGTPVIEVKVHQWNDVVDYTTYTDFNGTWTLLLPAGDNFELCIDNPKIDYKQVCYDGRLTLDKNGTLIP